MPSSKDILNDIDLRYRNTFTVPQKLVWFNEEQRELFDILELDSEPYEFTTFKNLNFYPFPADFDVTKIKTVTYQINDDYNADFNEIPFKRVDDNQYADSGVWWGIVGDTFYLEVPDGVPAGRLVYIYLDSDPTEVTIDNLEEPPDLPTKYQEILKYGVLKRIAGARKDVVMQSNFDAEHEQKIVDVLWQRKLAEPNFITPTDVMPKIGRWY